MIASAAGNWSSWRSHAPFPIRREPVSAFMIGVGMLALAANIICLILISSRRNHGAHMKASYLFPVNDVIANLGVIAAGFLMNWTSSPYPDLVIGTIISIIVMNGARRILQLT
jgi:Co/Zn/Cd efflux system component